MSRVRILQKGVFACFEPGLKDADGQSVNAEVSAVAWDGRRLVMASDKDVPGDQRSPVFALDCVDGLPQPDSLQFYTADLIRTAEKYEDFALTAEGNHLIATTGFDRVDGQSAAMHHYNRLLIWPVGDPATPHLIADRKDEGVRSSVGLRDDLEAALGAPYYKVEGLAAIPGRDGADARLLFGIRELGQDHEHFDYVSRVVAAPYRMDGDALVFTGDFGVIYDFDPSRWDGVRFAVGLSSLEYDHASAWIYFLTSFEVTDDNGDEQVGAYLWALTLDDFLAGRDPELVQAEDGSPFEFANKAEGVAVLGDGRLFVVYDPDRALELEDEHPRDAREPHEAPYTLLALD
ncbi:hypothetical protein [Salinisphaera aquimarina]|uniref:DUF3616 domain-containing protein n=1 Tax=Salinisphaera aquimarina TaxID=2094031 RepID=A0ABV7EVI0_9GAMM